MLLSMILASCGGGSSIKVSIASNSSSSTLNAGSGAIAITATISNDSKKAGATFALSPATGCGTLVASSDGVSATYTPPSAATTNANCTATIAAASVSEASKSASLSLTIKAITVTFSNPPSNTTLGAGAPTITLTAVDSMATDTVTWNLVSSSGVVSGITRKAARPNVAQLGCGQLAPNGNTAVYTPPSASLASTCTATITIGSTINPNLSASQTSSIKFTVNPITVNLAPPASLLVVEGGTSGALTASMSNNGTSDATLNWSVSPAGCGTVSSATGSSVTYTAPAPVPAACNNAATVTVASDAAPSAIASANFTITPIAVSISSPANPLTLVEGATQTITATSNDPAGASTLKWNLSGSNCGSLLGTTGASNTYNAPAPLTAACTATVTVTSATDASKSTTLNVTVNPITVSITSPNGNQTVLSGASALAISASTNDPAGAANLNWSVNPSSCGSLSSTSGASNSYTPPAMLASQCVATVAVASKTDSSKTASLQVTVNPAPIAVAIVAPTSASPTVGIGGSLAVTSTLFNDANKQGFSYTLTPNTGCGSFSGMTWQSTTGATSTYTGTYSAAQSACSAALVLASVADPSQKATLNITVQPGISVSLSPDGTKNIDANNSLPITPTVSNDPAGKGVNLTLNPPTGCGSLSGSSVASGTSFNYIPPSSLANQCTAAIVATAISDSTKTDTLTLTVYPPLTLPSSNPSSLGSATVGAAYSGSIAPSGGYGSYTYTVTGLSDGLTYTTTSGVNISGTPTSPTTVGFSVKVQDSTGTTYGPVNYSIVVNPYTAVTLPATTLPAATVNQSYNAAINANGGTQTYTYTVNGTVVGSSPTLLSNGGGLYGANSGGNTLNLSGTPTATDPITLNVSVTDGEGTTVSRTYTVTVNQQSTLVINTSNLDVPQGMVSMPYGMNVSGNTVSGGTPPYSFLITNLPAGLTADTSGNITGTPSASGSTTVTLKVTDSTSASQTATFTLPVVPLPSGTNNSKLSGQYACIFHQERDSAVTVGGYNLYRGAAVLAFATDGNGNITGGEVDSNSPSGGYKSNTANGAITGTYAVGSDDRGYLKLVNGGKTMDLALAAGVTISNTFYQFRFTEMDDVGTSPSGKYGGGLCFKQSNTSTLSGEKMSGGYVFGMNGETAEGELVNMVGSIKVTNGAATGVMDMAEGTTASLDNAFTGSVAAADSFGRALYTCNQSGCSNMVIYLTNESEGMGVIMSTASHSSSDLYFGQIRSQTAANIAAAEPLHGPFVMYTSGLDSSGQNYKAMVDHGTGSTTAKSITIDGSAQNEAGTVKLNNTDVLGKPMAYTVDTSTGRTTITGQTGIVFYLYDTNEAVALFADIGNSGGNPENMLGWLETQTDPTANSGKWVYSDVAASYFMGVMYSGDYTDDSQTGTFTIDSSGNFQNFAQDHGGQTWATWDESLGGIGGQTVTGVVVPDTTIDPTGTLGVFDVNITPTGGTATTQVYCFATNYHSSSSNGRLICLDATSQSPQITLIQE
jgi:hypothetical protein